MTPNKTQPNKENISGLSADEQLLVTELVADGLSIQDRFRAEPIYKLTGQGHYQCDTIEEIKKAKLAQPG